MLGKSKNGKLKKNSYVVLTRYMQQTSSKCNVGRLLDHLNTLLLVPTNQTAFEILQICWHEMRFKKFKCMSLRCRDTTSWQPAN